MSSVKYHVNPYTYKVMPCTAQVRCEYEDHADTKHFDKDDMGSALAYAEELGSRSHKKVQTLTKKETKNNLNDNKVLAFRKSKQEWLQKKANLSEKEQHNFLKKEATEIMEDVIKIQDKHKNPYYSPSRKLSVSKLNGDTSNIHYEMLLLHKENKEYLSNFAYSMSDEDIKNSVDIQNKIRLYFPQKLDDSNNNHLDDGLMYAYGDDNKSFEEVSELDRAANFSEEDASELKKIAKSLMNSDLDNQRLYNDTQTRFKEAQKTFILKKALKKDNIPNIIDRLRDFQDFQSRLARVGKQPSSTRGLKTMFLSNVQKFNRDKIRSVLQERNNG